MNTREKILTPGDALRQLNSAASRPALWIGYFDPLLVESIPAGRAPVWVAVDDPPNPLYPADARMKLVAALREVTHVFPYVTGVEFWPFDSVNDLRAQHLTARAAFIRHVHARQNQ